MWGALIKHASRRDWIDVYTRNATVAGTDDGTRKLSEAVAKERRERGDV